MVGSSQTIDAQWNDENGHEEGRIVGYAEELRGIPELAATGEALVRYAKSLFPKADFVKKGRRWVCEPNFIAFEVQPARGKHITFTIYGMRYKFDKHAVLPLQRTRASYLQFVIESPRQLGAATAYIANAARAYARRHRRQDLEECVGEI
jgi:hypothetical protein